MKCARCKNQYEVGSSQEVCNECLGVERGDPTPVALPLGYKHPPTIQEMIDQSIRAASRAAGNEGYDTLEEADDFGEDVDLHELPDNTKYTMMEDDEPFHVLKDRQTKALAVEKEKRENKEKRSDVVVSERRELRSGERRKHRRHQEGVRNAGRERRERREQHK